MGAATILGAICAVALALVALSMKWRRAAVWAASAAVASAANFALLLGKAESGASYFAGLLLPAILFLVLLISYIGELRRREAVVP